MSFIAQSQKYDYKEVDSILEDLEKELQDEVEIRKTLNSESAEKITFVKEFISQYENKISDQFVKIKALDQEIREYVSENENLEKLDKEYNDLVSSDSYLSLAMQMETIQSIASNLNDFLVKKGRRGRYHI